MIPTALARFFDFTFRSESISGRPIHVVVGRDFFNSGVSIDWAASRLKVQSPDVFLPEVILAGRKFERVPTLLSDVGNDHDPTQMANVGIGLLKELHVDLDLGKDRVFLMTRSDAPRFQRDRSGTLLELAGDRLKDAFVSPQVPRQLRGSRRATRSLQSTGAK